ncbi:MAG TPA: phenylalanine--tRNA ligase subunit beta [Bacteroidales bacterium]|nr:phenylalanine--tRNA ligase subunit beta [Bacteroidales bacterium]
MKISYNWLKDYINDLPSPEETAEILTSTGLEVEGLEKTESVRGGLQGVVIGEVKTCEKHPNADKLSVTTVDIGQGGLLPIVCGAPNVRAGQKVAVAQVGTTLFMGDDSLTLKKVKIRGEVSEGMICAEDELGLGENHEGIMVLDPEAEVGSPASDYFNITTDYIFEIGLTPNRIDGASHFGVARDLAAYLGQTREVKLSRPSVDDFHIDDTSNPIEVIIEDKEACKRYSGITVSGITVGPSPHWLQTKLRAIGLNPINNVVDITNFVLQETGQPLHAFDADKVSGKKVIVKTLPEGTPFVTLDEEERKLSEEDLMICNVNEGMCMAGVFGGIDSGVKDNTMNIFLESACFNPVYIRKTSKRHLLYTDSAFRFERGSDPDITVYALKRAALLIKELAGGKISSEVVDVYPEPVSGYDVNLTWEYLYRLIGKEIDKDQVKNILSSLDIKTDAETDTGLQLKVPPYRVDVQRPADVVEEVLRIYGYNQVEISDSLHSTLSYIDKPDKEKVAHLIAELLTSNGFNEMMSNSLTKSAYYEKEEHEDPGLVRIYNPLSSDLNAMRKSLLFGGLETISYNTNRKNADLRLYEFGNVYQVDTTVKSEKALDKYHEEEHLGLFLTGNKHQESWTAGNEKVSFYQLKAYVGLVLERMGFNTGNLKVVEADHSYFAEEISYFQHDNELVRLGSVPKNIRKQFDIDADVFFADFNWTTVMKSLDTRPTTFEPLPKYPEVRRDLSMVLEKSVRFEDIRKVASKAEKRILKNMDIFDVYEGDKIEKGRKSYAISFILQDETQTLTDKYIDKVMQNIARVLEKELGAQIRA